jgi:hypothetical protein
MKLSSIGARLHTAHSKYTSVIGDAESEISKYVDFDFSIAYQPSDGFVIVDEYSNNAPLSSCIGLIEETGSLLYKDYLRTRI